MNNITHDIAKLLDETCVNRVAEDLVVAIEESSKRELECDFKLNNGIMERSRVVNAEVAKALNDLHGKDVWAANTWCSFDSKLNSMLGFVKDSICKVMDNMSKEDFDLVSKFISDVMKKMNSDQILINRMKKAIRTKLLNNNDDTLFPIKEIYVVLWEFGDKEDYGDILKIFSYKSLNVSTGKYSSQNKGLAGDLIQRRRQFGYGRNQNTFEIYKNIIEEQKKCNNPLYDEVLPEDIQIVSEAKECEINLFVDYSPESPDVLIQKNIQKNLPEQSEATADRLS
jgi:hypothetical protein